MTTPSFTSAIVDAIDSKLSGLNISLPAKVETYDASDLRVSVKPLIKRRVEQEDGSIVLESLPIVTDVPLVFPGAGAYRITFPVSVGDTVLLVFASSSLDRWLELGGEVDPADDRSSALSDAIAIPGLRDFKNADSAHTSAVVIESDGDDILLGSQSAGDDVARRSDLAAAITAINGHTHGVVPGPGITPGTGSPAATSTKVFVD